MARSKEQIKLATGFRGIDLFSDPTQLDPLRWRRLQNMYPPRASAHILAKRLGSAKYNAAAISGATRIDNMIRAWKTDGTKKLVVAANKAGADELHVGNDIAGTFAQITGGSALPTNARWFFVNWPLLNKLYAFSGDGTIPIQISSDFATKSDMAAPAPNLPDARFGQFGAIFYSRLITARTPTNPNLYYMFDVASDTAITNATQFGRIAEPITAMGINNYATSAASLQAMLMLFGAHSTWYVAGDPTSTAPQEASHVIGCKSPKTFKNTEAGAMFLGVDRGGTRNVYLVNADPKLPQKVGIRVFPALQSIPETQLINATAEYHNGFYKLRFAAAGGATNTEEYWADLLPLVLGLPDAEVEWYGPMPNLALASLIVLDGPDDTGVYGGDATTGTVWKLEQTASYVDGALPIAGQLFSPEYTEGDPLREKIWGGVSFGIFKSADGQIQIDIVLNSGAARSSKQVAWTVSADEWDVAQWDVAQWAGGFFDEIFQSWDTRLVGHSMQIQVLHPTATDFQLRDIGRRYTVIPRTWG